MRGWSARSAVLPLLVALVVCFLPLADHALKVVAAQRSAASSMLRARSLPHRPFADATQPLNGVSSTFSYDPTTGLIIFRVLITQATLNGVIYDLELVALPGQLFFLTARPGPMPTGWALQQQDTGWHLYTTANPILSNQVLSFGLLLPPNSIVPIALILYASGIAPPGSTQGPVLGNFPTTQERATPTPSATSAPTQTATSMVGTIVTLLPTTTPTRTPTRTATSTRTPTPSNSPSDTLSPTDTETPTDTPTDTGTPTDTPTNTPTPTVTATSTVGPTPFAVIRPDTPDYSETYWDGVFFPGQDFSTLDRFPYVDPFLPLGLVTNGMLEFANQRVQSTSEPQPITITNSGQGPLRISRVEILHPLYDPGFKTGADTCSGATVAPEGSCTIEVTFSPDTPGAVRTYLGIFDNDYSKGSVFIDCTSAPGTISGSIWCAGLPSMIGGLYSGAQYVALQGAGTQAALPPLTVESTETTLSVPTWCRRVEGWRLVDVNNRQATLTGQVVQGHITSTDFSGNHNSIDYNFFVYPDPLSRNLLADPGNFQEGDPHEYGRIEVEWERFSRAWPGGLPAWAWPTQGDRVLVLGNHIFDCGHGLTWFGGHIPVIGGEGYRTEIHPPQLVVTYRNAGLAPFAHVDARLGSYHDRTWATRADVFASTYGGLAVAEENDVHGVVKDLLKVLHLDKQDHKGWWQDFPHDDFTFSIKAPPKPGPDAKLTYWVQYHHVPGVQEVGALQFTSRDDGYDVIIPFSALRVAPGNLTILGATIWVGWTAAPAFTEPHLHRYRIVLDQFRVRRDDTWALYGYVNEISSVLLPDGTRDALGTPFTKLTAGRTVSYHNLTYDVTLVDHQPLHIQFRAVLQRTLEDKLAGIAENILRGDPAHWSGNHSGGSICIQGADGLHCETPSYSFMASGYEERASICELCNVSCFDVKYHIQQLGN